MKIKRSISKIIAIGIIPLILVLFYNSQDNRHYHIVNGHLVEHSHPYAPSKKHSPIQHHHHTKGSYEVLSLISHGHSFGKCHLPLINLSFIKLYKEIKFPEIISKDVKSIYKFSFYRGPPSIFTL